MHPSSDFCPRKKAYQYFEQVSTWIFYSFLGFVKSEFSSFLTRTLHPSFLTFSEIDFFQISLNLLPGLYISNSSKKYHYSFQNESSFNKFLFNMEWHSLLSKPRVKNEFYCENAISSNPGELKKIWLPHRNRFFHDRKQTIAKVRDLFSFTFSSLFNESNFFLFYFYIFHSIDLYA